METAVEAPTPHRIDNIQHSNNGRFEGQDHDIALSVYPTKLAYMFKKHM